MSGCIKGMFVVDSTGALVFNSGLAASIANNAAGDNTVTLAESMADADTRFVVFPLLAIVASGLTSAGYTRPADNQIRVTSGVEGAVGAASALTAIDVVVIAMSIRGNMPKNANG